ncbi:hypothetical protein BJD78_gp07 [Arthrobacter phage KellEzio]|uniref:Uncharacterized protein n=1 Tax=Arthrobacter phage KellEzio TaxID=1796995 RepID=A0A140G692_9CAUD|nr:hypothetical protein BJD78_gp07 [Arthrobacter phage KellEzio]AMM44177.1 hypothetical protein KELLEZIO_7 [Arthrobacter phage KellEzio]
MRLRDWVKDWWWTARGWPTDLQWWLEDHHCYECGKLTVRRHMHWECEEPLIREAFGWTTKSGD